MTSKLRRTIVGVGIALGGAAPGCFGNSTADGDASDSDDDTFDAGDPDAGGPDASFDASSDAFADSVNPFCDVSWPPTKGNPTPGRVACVDPLGECVDAWPPNRCYKMLDPGVCITDQDRQGPLYCVNGEWHCPPGSDDGTACRCFPPSEADIGICPDAGAN
jgi:hypothetical protein